jgi:hypothetical protein
MDLQLVRRTASSCLSTLNHFAQLLNTSSQILVRRGTSLSLSSGRHNRRRSRSRRLSTILIGCDWQSTAGQKSRNPYTYQVLINNKIHKTLVKFGCSELDLNPRIGLTACFGHSLLIREFKRRKPVWEIVLLAKGLIHLAMMFVEMDTE